MKIINSGFPQDIKKTKQREEIFQIITSSKGPVSATEIYSKLLQTTEDTALAISTIYRALSVFEEKGYVTKSFLTGKDMAYYEWNDGMHRHYAICLSCHKLLPLNCCPIKNPELQATNFTVTGHKFELYGYCKSCRPLM